MKDKKYIKIEDGIGQTIAELRKERGLTQKEVEERANLYLHSLSRIENDKFDVSFRKVLEIVNSLDADILIKKREKE
ncbi:MAG: helix-turn-helix transcriptional regulator [Bacteroidales bacterium]|nr:helix-turn-helix transcriptional regulator [Bacteroidales bacterium]